MRRASSLFLLPLVLASGSALMAQSPHMGFSLNLISPTGAFASTSYPAYYRPTTWAWVAASRSASPWIGIWPFG